MFVGVKTSGNWSGVSFLSLALTNMSRRDGFLFSAMRGGSGKSWFKRGSFLTSNQIFWSSSLTVCIWLLYVRTMVGVLGVFGNQGFCLCMVSLKRIFLSSVLTALSLYPLARRAFWNFWICSLKFEALVLVLRNLCASPRTMQFLLD